MHSHRRSLLKQVGLSAAGLGSPIRSTWKDDHTLEMMWRFYEIPHHDLVTCRFDGARVRIEFLNSLAARGNRKETRPALVGQMASGTSVPAGI
jgi:hypothetical protein